MVAALRAGGVEREQQILTHFVEGHGSIAKLATHFGVNLRALYHWLQEDPERWERWQEAKKLRAEVLAEETLDIADEVSLLETSEGIRRAELRVKVRQWLAAVNNPTVYGKNQKLEVSHQHLHLVAVKEINAADTARRLAMQATKTGQPETVIAEPVLEEPFGGDEPDDEPEPDIFG